MVYPITKLWFYPLTSFFIKRIKGTENILSSNYIVVSNHENLIDPLLIFRPILKKLDRKVHFVATPTWWFLGGTLCRKWAGCIPLFSSKQAYAESKKIIKSKGIVGIFPEGGTKRTKNFKTGAVRLALQTKTPILPIGLKSSYLPFSSKINIGKPISVKKGNAKKITAGLMKQIYRLRSSA